jgi:actin-like protein 6B
VRQLTPGDYEAIQTIFLVNDFNPITSLISHAYNDVLRVTSSEHPTLVTESPWNTPANRERMAEIMFEEFNSPAFYIANTGVLNACVRLVLSITSGCL